MITYSQTNPWLLGEWRGSGVIPGSDYNTVFIRTLTIKTENKNRFTGLLVQESMYDRSIRIEKAVIGTIVNSELIITAGKTLYIKQPARGFWADCSACKITSTRLTVSSDSLILTSETRQCGNYCDGYSTYYKSLANFDTATQRQLIKTFGSPLLAKIFTPLPPNAIGSRNTAAADTMRQQLARKTKTIATYDVSSPDIKIELFDNGEIDGDSVTVYHNKQPIAEKQLLGLQPVVLSVKATAQDRVHEFVLVANNLGRVPPNTALMRITAGEKKFELFPSTDLQKNASVIIVYTGDR